jgi:O-methyltransferase domain/Dimerisation domain
MTAHTASGITPAPLLQARYNLIIHQALYAAAKLGVADLLERGSRTTAELATELKVNEEALYRTLRALAGLEVFEEAGPRTFRNSPLSCFLRTAYPGSVRSFLIYWGTEFYYRSLGEILYSIQTGKPARAKLVGMNEWEYMRQNPELAGIFDDAMTNGSDLMGPPIAAAYDFEAWGSIMDVGGGNGILLSHILKVHQKLRGVLADQPHVLERARQRGFLGGELASRTSMRECDFFREVPSGCRAYLMKSVIHDWDDEKARQILINCRRAVPSDGILLLVEWGLSEANLPSAGKLMDLVMLALTGGKERTIEEYGELLASAGFRFQGVTPTPAEYVIIEAVPG